MADRKISELAAVTTLAGTEEFVVAVGGATKKITAADLMAAFGSAAFHGVRAVETTDQNVATGGGGTAITFNDTEQFDTDGYHSTSSNTSRLTVPSGLAGYYRIAADLRPADDAGTYLQALLKVNGTTTIPGSEDIATIAGAGADYFKLKPQATYFLGVGDYVEVVCFHGSGTNEIIRNSFSPGIFGMEFLGT